MTIAANFWVSFKWLMYLIHFQHKKKKKPKPVRKLTSSDTLTWTPFVCNH